MIVAGLLVVLAFYTALVGLTGRMPAPKGGVFPSIGIRSRAVCQSVETWRAGHLAAEPLFLAGAGTLVAAAGTAMLWGGRVVVPAALGAWLVLVSRGLRRARRAAFRLIPMHARGPELHLRTRSDLHPSEAEPGEPSSGREPDGTS